MQHSARRVGGSGSARVSEGLGGSMSDRVDRCGRAALTLRLASPQMLVIHGVLRPLDALLRLFGRIQHEAYARCQSCVRAEHSTARERRVRTVMRDDGARAQPRSRGNRRRRRRRGTWGRSHLPERAAPHSVRHAAARLSSCSTAPHLPHPRCRRLDGAHPPPQTQTPTVPPLPWQHPDPGPEDA